MQYVLQTFAEHCPQSICTKQKVREKRKKREEQGCSTVARKGDCRLYRGFKNSRFIDLKKKIFKG